ncbi:hypothetical protein [Kribbella deserti]|uniref:Uncharacterized protein n=1 Tax=Kribbella deserti TaxID=1926257 RepID=A0ABV6QIW2_9ACTN
MQKKTGFRLSAITAVALGTLPLLAGTALADATVSTVNGIGKYESAANRLIAHDTGCDTYAVYVEWHWLGVSDTAKKLWDHNCDSTDPAVKVILSPPSNATGISIKVCRWVKDGADVCSNTAHSAK